MNSLLKHLLNRAVNASLRNVCLDELLLVKEALGHVDPGPDALVPQISDRDTVPDLGPIPHHDLQLHKAVVENGHHPAEVLRPRRPEPPQVPLNPPHHVLLLLLDEQLRVQLNRELDVLLTALVGKAHLCVRLSQPHQRPNRALRHLHTVDLLHLLPQHGVEALHRINYVLRDARRLLTRVREELLQERLRKRELRPRILLDPANDLRDRVRFWNANTRCGCHMEC